MIKGKKRSAISIVAFALALLCCLVASVLSFVFTGATSSYEEYSPAANISLSTFCEDRLFLAEKGGKALYVKEEKGDARVIKTFDSEIVDVFSSDGVLAVSLHDRHVHLLDLEGNILFDLYTQYPTSHFAYSAAQRKIAVSAFISNTQKYVFVYEEVDFATTVGYSYMIKPTEVPVNLGISPVDGEVYYAGYTGRVYQCERGVGDVEVLAYPQLINSFCITELGDFVLGSQNGYIDVYMCNGARLCGEKTGDMPVRVAYSKGCKFAALTDDGELFFVDYDGVYSSTKVSGMPTTVGFSYSKNGDVAMTRAGELSVFAEGKAASYAAFSIVKPIALVLSVIFAVLFVCAILFRTKPSFKAKCVKKGKRVWKSKKYYLMLLPMFAFLGVFIYYPVVWGLSIAFQKFNNGVFVEWVFLDNFREAFVNEYFLSSMKNMSVLLVTDLLKALVVPLILAELLLGMRSQRSQYAARVAMYLPAVLPGVATMLLWRYGIYGTNGLLNGLFKLFGVQSLAEHSFLGSESTALASIIFMGFPWVGSYIIVYGALAGIPKSFYEAARLDGCSPFRRVFAIDIPMLVPQFKYIFLTAFISSIQDFNRIYLTTEGGPGKATYTPALELYFNINRFHNYGAAAAMGIFLFLLIFICSRIFMSIGKGKEEENAL